jgi:hypothetical protein
LFLCKHPTLYFSHVLLLETETSKILVKSQIRFFRNG